MTVTQPCVSVGTGTLSPDLRVFYQYGMVLGLDDFLQEQTHNLGLDYHHERALHGYGTVYGLHVTTTTPPDALGDVTVTVEPGMAVDQWGREVTLPTAQCARLGAWLAAQGQATAEAHLGSSGELVVYVVAAYAECPDNLVPLPGQPCSTSSQMQVPSRLRDAWDIELRWAPPAMPAWDAVRRLGQLLSSIQIVPGPDVSLASDEEAIIEAVLALPSPHTPSGSPSGPTTYQLPADAASAAFDRILTVWVTQVRPQLAPDLTAPDPAWDASILLSAITFTPQMPFSASGPAILSYSDPDDTGRPYLLHTELIQELRLGGQAEIAPAPPVQEAVTLSSTVDSNGEPTLSAWFHLPEPVRLPADIQVTDQNGQTAAFTAEAPSGAGPFSDLWTLQPPGSPSDPGFTVTDGDQLTATFPGSTVHVGNSGTTLADAVTGQGVLNTTAAGDVTAYTVARGTPPASVPFVTVSFVPAVERPTHLELWFHPHQQSVAENVTVTIKHPSVQVLDDNFNTLFPVANSTGPTQIKQNVWTISFPDLPKGPYPLYLRLIILTEQTQLNVVGMPPDGGPPLGPTPTLADWINHTGVRYVGWEGATIECFARIVDNVQQGSIGG